MEDKIYIRFNNPIPGNSAAPDGPVKKAIKNNIVKTLTTIIPRANPDFEHLLDQVEFWKIEYNKRENATWREIGFNKDEISIVAMPLVDNYGFWTDNHLTLDDYDRFDPTPITKDVFEKDWTEFERNMKK